MTELSTDWVKEITVAKEEIRKTAELLSVSMSEAALITIAYHLGHTKVLLHNLTHLLQKETEVP